jgi:hypothetical protein
MCTHHSSFLLALNCFTSLPDILRRHSTRTMGEALNKDDLFFYLQVNTNSRLILQFWKKRSDDGATRRTGAAPSDRDASGRKETRVESARRDPPHRRQ